MGSRNKRAGLSMPRNFVLPKSTMVIPDKKKERERNACRRSKSQKKDLM